MLNCKPKALPMIRPLICKFMYVCWLHALSIVTMVNWPTALCVEEIVLLLW